MKERKKVNLKTKFKVKRKPTNKEKQKIKLAISEEMSVGPNDKDFNQAHSSSVDESPGSSTSKHAPNKEDIRNKSSKALLKGNRSNLRANMKLVSPKTLLRQIAPRKKSAEKEANKSQLITPIAARVKRIKRKIENLQPKKSDASLAESPNIPFKEPSNLSNLRKTLEIETDVHIGPTINLSRENTEGSSKGMQMKSRTSKDIAEETSLADPRGKNPSFVTAVFAAKKAKSSKNKTSIHSSPKPTTSKQNLKSKQASRAKNLDDDLVTKYLKKFKDSISPKKNASNISIKTVKESSKSSPVSAKGKGIGKKTKSVKQKCEPNVDSGTEDEMCEEHLPSLKKNSSKRSLKTGVLEDDQIFKRPNKPVGQKKEKSKKSKNSVTKDEVDSKNKLKNKPNSKSSKRSTLRSSRR